MSGRIHIDGSFGEGGGQILRTGMALAALLQQPVEISNIRANRSSPGLKTQHLTGVLALAEITAAEVSGARMHSTHIGFSPRTIKGGKYCFEIGTAGSACMLLEAVLPALLFARDPSEIIITGGTHVPFSPPYDYLEGIFIPMLRRLGANVRLDLVRYGFYPKGGGAIRAYVEPCRGLQGLQLQERGTLRRLNIKACSANLPDHIVHREIDRMETCLAGYEEKIVSKTLSERALSPGNFVSIKAEYAHTLAGFNGLGRRGKPAEDVAEEACREFIGFERTQATMDAYLADQIILYMALARGDSAFVVPGITSHLRTNIEVITRLLSVDIRTDRTTGAVELSGAGNSFAHQSE